MKGKDLCILGFQEFKNDKKKYLSIFLTTLCSICIILSISYMISLRDYWNNSVKNYIDFRSFYVSYDHSRYTEKEAMEVLKKQPHVVEVGDRFSYLITMRANDYVKGRMKGTIYLEGTSRDGIQTVIGNDLTKYSDDEDVIVCAKQFYPNIETYMSDYDEKYSVDLSKEVGKDMSLSFLGAKDQVEKFKLVGLYDARKNYTEGNVCYASFETVSKLNQKYQPEVFSGEGFEFPIVMILDNVENKDLVFNNIKSLGFLFDDPMIQINTQNGNEITLLTTIGAIIILVMTILVDLVFTLKETEDKKSYYAIMKSYGYDNNSIHLIQTIHNLMIRFISVILSIPFAFLMISLIKKYYFKTKIMYANVDFSIRFIGVLVSLLVCLFIPLFASLISRRKIKKIQIIEEIKC